MWPALKNTLHSFLFDETAFVRGARSSIMVLAASGTAYSEQIATTLGAPDAVHTIKVISVACAGLAMMLGAGDKNPPPPTVPVA